MRWLLVAVLWVCFTGSAQAVSDADRLLLARLTGLEATSRMLLHFNPYLDNRELVQHDYRQNFSKLADQLGGVEGEDFSQLLSIIFAQLEILETMTDGDESMLPTILNPVLTAQHEIDDRLGRIATGELDPLRQQLGDQAMDIARLSLWYQIRLFSGLRVFADDAGEDLLGALDVTIEQRFFKIGQEEIEESSDFKISLRNYQFVRSQILNPQSGWIPDAAALYLQKSIKSLLQVREGLATTRLQTPGRLQ